MKYRSELNKARDKELFRIYREYMCRPDVQTHQEAIRLAIKTPTTRFWISTIGTYKDILNMKFGRPLIHVSPDKVRMLHHIYEIYKKLERQPAFRGQSVCFITAFAIQHPAPEFYISYSRAAHIIDAIRRHKNEL